MMRGREVIALVLLFLLISRKGKRMSTVSPSVRRWEAPILAAGSNAIAPIDFLLRWIAVESAGNPCAIGSPGVLDPDGEPWEVSIWQLDPGNRKIAGFTAAQLRPCCASSTGPEVQVCTRELTPDEVSVQVRAGLRYVSFCRSKVDAALAGVAANGSAASEWGFGGDLTPSYLRAVKSVHGSPIVMDEGVSAVARKLGRAPRSWSELASTLRADPSLVPRLNVRRSSGELLLEAVLRNAEETWP